MKTLKWTGSKGNEIELRARCEIGSVDEVLDADGYKYVALAAHSYHYCGYDNSDPWGRSGYTYVREPDPTDRTVYADRPATHIELRPDVEILSNGADGAAVTWDPDLPCPFVYLPR